jgi:hypothetical protein
MAERAMIFIPYRKASSPISKRLSCCGTELPILKKSIGYDPEAASEIFAAHLIAAFSQHRDRNALYRFSLSTLHFATAS